MPRDYPTSKVAGWASPAHITFAGDRRGWEWRQIPNRSRCSRAQSTERRVVLSRPWTGGVGQPRESTDGDTGWPRLGVLRPQTDPVVGEHSHRVGHRLNNTRPDGLTCGGQLSTAAVQPSLH